MKIEDFLDTELSHSDYSLGPCRDVGDLRIEYHSGGPDDKHDWPVLLRASGRHYGDDSIEINVERHIVLRYTPCGAWIDTWAGERFVNLRCGKQWASTTEAEAIDQLWHRKQSEVKILESRLEGAKAVKAAMQQHLGKVPRKPARYVPDYEY